ncbi:sulfate adenylyltransferase subunit 1 [Podospora aff. communis PSN243]|uniref:Sulfate adenylyltransferase subunit 1 n=1 Tax=Podospora aff. communis PSN243 TaxID=3040156 RepID=A0AAV9GXP2_9PEZI|nr:sulfate adenylyltransferase subunit 1 [Podospora aff. communis PSN243]
MAPKSLAVLGHNGVGKKTIVGNLIFTCGLDLRQLQQLESGTDRKMASIVPFFDKNGIAKAFYAPSGQIIVEDTNPTPNIAFWVVDASSPDGGASSKAELESQISAGSLKPTEKLIILLNKMDEKEWSEAIYNEMAALFQQAVNLPSVQVKVVPIAALQGDNILEPPSGISWTENTLMQALE